MKGRTLNKKMMVRFILSMALFCLVSFAEITISAQDCTELKNDYEIRQELQGLANSAANSLMKCCSTWGGENLRATIIWDKDADGLCQTRISRLTNEIIITMTVSWTGSISGDSYWIKGKLIFNTENKRRKWEKINDSGGFQPGCSNGCIY